MSLSAQLSLTVTSSIHIIILFLTRNPPIGVQVFLPLKLIPGLTTRLGYSVYLSLCKILVVIFRTDEKYKTRKRKKETEVKMERSR